MSEAKKVRSAWEAIRLRFGIATLREAADAPLSLPQRLRFYTSFASDINIFAYVLIYKFVKSFVRYIQLTR